MQLFRTGQENTFPGSPQNRPASPEENSCELLDQVFSAGQMLLHTLNTSSQYRQSTEDFPAKY